MSRLFLILGDQLHPFPHPLLADFAPSRDQLLMVEALEESTHVWSHKARSALFLAAMRHRAEGFRQEGLPIDYRRLGEHPHTSLGEALAARLGDGEFSAVVMLVAGDDRIQEALEATCARQGVALLVRPDATITPHEDDDA